MYFFPLTFTKNLIHYHSIAVANIFVYIHLASAPSLNIRGICDAFLKQCTGRIRQWKVKFNLIEEASPPLSFPIYSCILFIYGFWHGFCVWLNPPY